MRVTSPRGIMPAAIASRPHAAARSNTREQLSHDRRKGQAHDQNERARRSNERTSNLMPITTKKIGTKNPEIGSSC